MLIASRILKLQTPSGQAEIPIRIFAPEQDKGGWSCRYEIDWPDQPLRMAASGIDSAQALVLALKMIGSEVYASQFHKSGKLFVERPGQGYGFPVTSDLRDLLQGDDAKYL